MAVAYDTFSDSISGTGTEEFTTATSPVTWTHTPVGTPRGVLIFAIQRGSSTDEFTGAITYGGQALTAVTGGRAIDTGGETGATKAYFLGTGIPSGAQTVSIAHAATAGVSKKVWCVTVTAAADTAIAGTPVLLQEDGTLAQQNVDSGADVALRFAGLFSGLNTAPTVGANSTNIDLLDQASLYHGLVRETTGGSGSRPVGWSSGTSDDRAAVHLAIKESAAAAVTRSFAVIIG